MLKAIPDGIWWGIAILIGVSVGSLLNVIAYRLPQMIKQREGQQICRLRGQEVANCEMTTTVHAAPLTLFAPASFCPYCQTTLAFFDKLPLISWLRLKGHCRYCQRFIHWHYPLFELCIGIAAAYLARHYPLGITWFLLLSLVSLLLVLVLIDLREQLLPDSLTYSMLWCGLLWHSINDSVFLPQSILGVVLGYLSLWGLYWGYKILSGQDGLGYGDFKLLAALGAWFGWRSLPEMVVIAALFTLLFAAVMGYSLTKAHHKAIPFGPGLALAGLGELYLLISH